MFEACAAPEWVGVRGGPGEQRLQQGHSHSLPPLSRACQGRMAGDQHAGGQAIPSACQLTSDVDSAVC